MKPDLITQDFRVVSFDLNPPEFNFNYTIANRGEASSGNFNVGFYLSQDQFIDRTDTLLSPINSNTFFSNLDAGQNTDPLNTIVSLDGHILTGEYYLGMFIDNLDMVSESDEQNNTSSQVLRIMMEPDLKGSYFKIAPTSADAGNNIHVDFEISNDGLVSPSQAVKVDFFLSDNPDIDPDQDFLLHSEEVDRGVLNPHSSSGRLQANIDLEKPYSNFPYSGGDGTYYIGMVIDPNNNISEINEFNNSNGGKFLDYDSLDITNTSPPVTIQLPPSPRLNPRHTGIGDTDFDGNGPQLVAIPEVSIAPNGRSIEVTFEEITFKETKADGTSFSVRNATAAVYTLDDLFNDQGIQGYIFEELDDDGILEGENDKISSELDEYFFPELQAPGQRTYEDNDHDVNLIPGGDLISQYAVFGDADGGLFGGPDQPWLRVQAFKPIDVFLAPDPWL